MLKNYITTTLRNIRKHKVFSMINIAGLAVGLACVLVIISYVRFELSFDDFHENSQNIYRVAVNWEDEGQRVNMAMNHAPLAAIVKEQLPGVIHTTRIYPYPTLISVDRQNKVKENNFVFADSTFFDVFTLNSLHGDLKSALDFPGALVLTESAAIRHFGSADVVGKELYYQDQRREMILTITAVIEDFPQNSHFHLDFITAFSVLDQLMPRYNNWHYPPMYIYLETNGSRSVNDLNTSINPAVYDHLPDYVQAEKRDYFLQPVADIHLHSALESEWEANSTYASVRLFLIIALFILLIASINFMNLATAKSADRAKEVGMRKVFGANKKQLIYQFLGESFITTLLAAIIAFGLAELVLIHVFNGIIEQHLSIMFLTAWPYLGYVISGLVIISLLSGLYPAFYIAAHRPSKSLKGKVSAAGGLNIRRALVTFQFFISSLLIVGTLLVLNQTEYLRNKRLGFDKELIVSINLDDSFAQKNYAVLKEQLLAASGVQAVALSSTLPGRDKFYGFESYPEGIGANDEYTLKTLGVDEDFITTYDIRLLDGRDFSKDIISDQKEGFILNEAAVKKLDWEKPIGKEFGLTVYINGEEKRLGKVIGVVEDFHFESLYKEVEPLVMYINKHPYYADYLSVKFEPGDVAQSVQMLEEKWKAFNPERPLLYSFLDQSLDELYKGEVKRSELFSAFALLSIIISCMGLFGLAAYAAQQKTKEVGIRKVLGAGVGSIFKLLSKEYVILILIANVISIPLAWYWAEGWLSGFANRITISPFVFVLSLSVALLIALLTVSYQAVKAAVVNPINSLRDE